MAKFVQLLTLFVIASSLSMSATVLDWSSISRMPSGYSVTNSYDFGTADLTREFRSNLRTFTPEVCCNRPTPDANITLDNTGMDLTVPITLGRPQFSTRFVSNGDAVVPTPEPSSLVLLASGLLSGAYFVRRRK